ncbi:N-acetyltransferase family protein [Desulfococcus sp.]|uniref:GNAT family N-acetyltransferase n=1 Tax=Desulfococcus sp. TaxID=2025834 RepID=UPI0035931772
MVSLRDFIEGLCSKPERAKDWVEMVRDLKAPICVDPPDIEFSMRWADAGDMLVIAALQGFVKGEDFLDKSLEKGDRFLLLEHSGRICAFAWVAFRDYPLDLLHTLHLDPGAAYLVYIVVMPGFQQKGVGLYLLGSLMLRLRERGCHTLVSGMYEDWHVSIRLHLKAGFRITRKFQKRRILRIIPYPPKVIQVEE